MDKLTCLYNKMLAYFSGDPRRCQHLIKVHSLARQIGTLEGLDAQTLLLLEAAALVHDCGIKPGEAKYGLCTGKIQEEEGPNVARQLLADVGFSAAIIERVAFLVGHHHTYAQITGVDYQILVEADFLVNFYEDQLPKETIAATVAKIFRTRTGRQLAAWMFALPER